MAEDQFRYEQLEALLLGQAPKPPEAGVTIGNTAVSPAILALQFAISHSMAFEAFLRQQGTYPKTVEDQDLPEGALKRDLKVAVNACLVIEDVGGRIQAHMREMEAQGG